MGASLVDTSRLDRLWSGGSPWSWRRRRRWLAHGASINQSFVCFDFTSLDSIAHWLDGYCCRPSIQDKQTDTSTSVPNEFPYIQTYSLKKRIHFYHPYIHHCDKTKSAMVRDSTDVIWRLSSTMRLAGESSNGSFGHSWKVGQVISWYGVAHIGSPTSHSGCLYGRISYVRYRSIAHIGSDCKQRSSRRSM